MLLLKNQFILKQGIRNPLYILNPPIVTEDEVNVPRYSVIHYLDTTQNNHFPTRELYYFKDISNNKKIHTTHITDLDTKDEVSVLENKYVNTEVRKWFQTNLKSFKNTELLQIPNTDATNLSVFNYNLLKDLYRYKTSLLSKHYKFFNLYTTYYNTVKKAIQLDKDSVHFISIDIPNNIPSYNLIDIILKFNTIKFSRIISDESLIKVIDLYRWLSTNNRERSTLKNITDEDSTRIIVEFKYKGYITFLPLNVLRSLSEDSSLESTVKYKDIKVRKLFILMLHKFQDKVNGLLEGEQVDQVPIEDTTETDKQIEETFNDTSSVDDNEVILPDNVSSFISPKKEPKLANLDELNKLADNIEIDTLDKLIDINLSRFDKENEEIDEIYEETILKASKELEVESTKEIPTEQILSVDYSEEHVDTLLKAKTLDRSFEKHIKEAVEFKTLTSTEIRSLKKLKENRTLFKSPYESDMSLDDFKITANIKVELDDSVTQLTIKNNLLEDNLKKEVINNFDKNYLNKLLKKDIISCVSNLERGGVIIKDYQIEENRSSLGNYEVHKLTLKPLTGKESTVYFRLPVIDSEGEFLASGIKYRMRKTKQPIPVVKVSPTRVALTSNYSKLFIFRTERKTNDPYAYLVNYIKNSYINNEGSIRKIIPGVKTLNTYQFPNTYQVLASHFNEIRTDDVTLLLNFKEIENHVSPEVLKDIQSKNLIFTGYTKDKHILVIDNINQFYNYSNNMSPLGTIEELLNIDTTKIPKPFSVMKVLGDDIPLGICLSYYLGLTGLLSVTNTTYKLLESNQRYTPTSNELALRFSDYKLILNTDTIEKQLIFNGYLFYKDLIKQHNLKEFDYKEIYLNVLEFRDSGLIHIKELNLLEELFLDPITVDVLREMQEPTEFLRLLLRANNLLKDFSHPDINDPHYSRIRGYDRVPGLMYRALSESIRDFKLKGRGNSKIELDPYKVWNYITQDSTVKITEDINPILNIKESETVTLSGADGLNKDATPKMLRRYHKNEIGLTSEATVDSSDVALNTYLSPYAKIKNLRGIIDKDNLEVTDNPAKAFSTSALLVPMSDRDDAKRINFISIQNSHTIAANNYNQPLFRTTYEYMVPYKAGKLYSIIAEEDGEIIDLTPKLLTVKYKSGKIASYKVGQQYGRMEGGVYPHFLKTPYSKGYKFKANDYIAYNESFFEPDWLDKTRLVSKFGKNITVALTMNNEVFEDSSAISKELMTEMATSIIKEKIYIIDFNKNLLNLLPEGTQVDPNTILFTVLDDTGDYNNLSEASIAMLQNLSSLAPKAKYNGIIERYEIKYNGETSDMSPTLRKLTNKLDKQLFEETKGTDYEAHNNKVSSEYRSEGKNLNIDTLELKVFIRIELNQGVGDKGTLAGQMKSVISDVFTSNITTDSGIPVHMQFSFKGILNRQVNSCITAGTTNRLIKHVSKQVADIYFK